MRRELTGPARAAAILAITILAATACTSGSDDESERSSIDAKAYYDEYEAGSYDGQTLMATQEDSAIDPGGSTQRSDPGSDKVVPCDDCAPPRRLPPPPIDGDNQFKNPGTNPAVDPSQQQTSTFGLDVDTGSYRIAKHFLNKGILPPTESVRPEEWINAFDYSDQSPTESDLGITSESGTASATTATQLFRVAVAARELRDSERPPASLTFVVDTSGSMDIRERLGLVKSSLALLTKSLRPDDKIAIVTYDEQARGVLEPTPVSDTGTILDAIDDLEPGGGTNLEAGVELGYEYAAENDGAGINAVILASDGVANVGLTNPDGLADKVNAAATGEDIHLVTVGYGMGNYND
ncbi:MAG: vWA domain-containing protein, partial [Nocardioidaceae bacterium]